MASGHEDRTRSRNLKEVPVAEIYAISALREGSDKATHGFLIGIKSQLRLRHDLFFLPEPTWVMWKHAMNEITGARIIMAPFHIMNYEQSTCILFPSEMIDAAFSLAKTIKPGLTGPGLRPNTLAILEVDISGEKPVFLEAEPKTVPTTTALATGSPSPLGIVVGNHKRR